MITFRYIKFVVCLIILQPIVFIQNAYCQKYTNATLRSIKFCDINPYKLNDERPAVIINSYNKFIERSTSHVCDFVIETQNNQNGIFAVIQNIVLRETKTGECLDTIKFKREDRQGREFCGKFNRSFHAIAQQMDFTGIFNSRDYGEFGPRGYIRTIINIAPEKVVSNFEINLTIVYTMFKACNATDPKRYRRVMQDMDICIPKEYFCDGIYNCGGVDNCLDEVDCPETIDITSDRTGTKVIVAVVTTIVHIFVIFTICMWILRRQKKLCWSPDCAGPSSERNTPALSLNTEYRGANNPVATAPMFEVALLNAVQDKDLPPSYDSLFPENANAAHP